jgi:acyl-CoA synthetase (AMP-forming)/AMP-acid ligase II
MNYEELDDAASRLATFLDREGVRAGDRVAVSAGCSALRSGMVVSLWRLILARRLDDCFGEGSQARFSLQPDRTPTSVVAA